MLLPSGLLDIISYLSVGLTVCSTIIFWRSQLKTTGELTFLGYYLLLLVLTEASSKTLYLLDRNNLPILHIYTLLELVLLSLFYKKIGNWGKPILWITIISSTLILCNTIFLQPIQGFNNNARTLEQIIIIIYSIAFFFNYPTRIANDKSLAQSLNLINSAILIYFSGSLFIFMFSQLFIDKREVYLKFWVFNAFLSFLFQLLVFISLWRIAFRKQT